jgi:hypothetical protein
VRQPGAGELRNPERCEISDIMASRARRPGDDATVA